MMKKILTAIVKFQSTLLKDVCIDIVHNVILELTVHLILCLHSNNRKPFLDPCFHGPSANGLRESILYIVLYESEFCISILASSALD